MQLLTTNTAIVLAIAASTSFAAFAAPAAEQPKVTDAQADKASANKAQPQSDSQEKSGKGGSKKSAAAKAEKNKDATAGTSEEKSGAAAQSSAANSKSGKMKPEKDQSTHFHPRDGK